jgi:hypothetical protein
VGREWEESGKRVEGEGHTFEGHTFEGHTFEEHI